MCATGLALSKCFDADDKAGSVLWDGIPRRAKVHRPCDKELSQILMDVWVVSWQIG